MKTLNKSFVLSIILATAVSLFGQGSYKQPPKEIMDVLNAPATDWPRFIERDSRRPDLLEPVDQRPKQFWRGLDLLDAVQVGFSHRSLQKPPRGGIVLRLER